MALIIAAVVLAVVFVCTLRHIPSEDDLIPSEDDLGGKDDVGAKDAKRAKLREDMIFDIRGANQYCLGYLALLGVIATIAASHLTDIRPVLDRVPFCPFEVAFGAATISMLFVPAGYGGKSFSALRIIWLRTIVCEQVTVVAASYGIWRLCAAII